MTRDRALTPGFAKNKIAVAEDGREEIVEIVRDAAGELAERFHFLGAAELILQLFARGDVHERADEASRLAGCVARR